MKIGSYPRINDVVIIADYVGENGKPKFIPCRIKGVKYNRSLEQEDKFHLQKITDDTWISNVNMWEILYLFKIKRMI